MSQAAHSDAEIPKGDLGHGATPSVTSAVSPHPLAVVKPRARTSKEEDEEIIKEVVSL